MIHLACSPWSAGAPGLDLDGRARAVSYGPLMASGSESTARPVSCGRLPPDTRWVPPSGAAGLVAAQRHPRRWRPLEAARRALRARRVRPLSEPWLTGSRPHLETLTGSRWPCSAPSRRLFVERPASRQVERPESAYICRNYTLKRASIGGVAWPRPCELKRAAARSGTARPGTAPAGGW